MKLENLLTTAAVLMIVALTLGACGTSGPVDATGLRRVVGTDLIGARGATPQDQRKIDRTVVGVCSGGVWTKDECKAHGDAVK